MAATALNDYIYQLHEFWSAKGPPAETFGRSGSFFRQLQKTVRADWQGTGTAQLPVRSSIQGNAGPNFSKVRANHSSSSGEQFLIPAADFWLTMQLSNRFVSFTRDPMYLESNLSGLNDEMEQTAAAWMRACSYLLWSDGRGGIGKGDGAFAVAGSTITLRNAASAACFEVGDVLRMVLVANFDAAAPGTLPTPEAGTLTVTAVDEDAGTLTVAETINVAIPTATNTAFISKDVYFSADIDQLFTGVFGFLAETNTLANTSFYGVTRSTSPTRLAGQRVNLAGSESPWSICSAIMDKANTSGAKIDQIWYPASQTKALMEEMASRNIHFTRVEVGLDAPQNLRIGFTAASVCYGDMECQLISDRFLIDPAALTGEDVRYVGLNSAECEILTSDGISWKDYDGDGSFLVRDPATQVNQAEYGAFCAYQHRDTHNAIVARVGADA
jgi:hypothetical protein